MTPTDFRAWTGALAGHIVSIRMTWGGRRLRWLVTLGAAFCLLLILQQWLVTTRIVRYSISAPIDPKPASAAKWAETAVEWIQFGQGYSKRTALQQASQNSCAVTSGSSSDLLVQLTYICMPWRSMDSNRIEQAIKVDLESLLFEGAKVKLLSSVQTSIFQKVVNTVAGVFVGLLTVVATTLCVSLLGYYLRDRLRYGREFSALTGFPIAAAVGNLPKMRFDKSDAISPASRDIDSFNRLRYVISTITDQSGPVLVCVSSCEPGDGKTTIAAALGVACGFAGMRTIIIDADEARPSQAHIFGARVRQGWLEVASNTSLSSDEFTMSQAVEESLIPTLYKNVRVLHCGVHTDRKHAIIEHGFEKICRASKAIADIVIVDTGPLGRVPESIFFCALADVTVLVACPGITRRSHLLRITETLNLVKCKRVIGLLNRVTPHDGAYSPQYHLGYGYGTHSEAIVSGVETGLKVTK